MITTLTRSRRILKNIDSYKELYDKSKDIPPYLKKIPSIDEDTLIGVYTNEAGNEKESIVIMDLGFYIFYDNCWRKIKYDQIVKVETDGHKYIDEFTVHDIYNNVFVISVKGKKEIVRDISARDVFAFIRFINRVVADKQKQV